MKSYFHDLLHTFRVADAFDIAVMTLVILGGLSWFRTRAARSIGVFLVALACIYVLARRLEMYLTTQLFQIGFVGAALAFVIVFQQDIRRGFEQVIAAFNFTRIKKPDHDHQFVDLIQESICWLAGQKIGALLVFPGKEPLDHHIQGGVMVDGQVSLPLVCSIFHPNSPGHDGAVVIDGQRLARLGAHLPLSGDQSQLQGRGTRHAAALGLSECSDALIIVISEERGTVSSAQNGRLVPINQSHVGELLRSWIGNREAANKPLGQRGIRWLGLPFASFAVACLLWLVFANQTDTVQRTIVIPVEYRNLSEGWIVDDPKTNWAEVTLTGSEQAFKFLDASAFAVSFDLGKIRSEAPVELATLPHLKNIPSVLSVEQIQPEEVIVKVRQRPAGKTR